VPWDGVGGESARPNQRLPRRRKFRSSELRYVRFEWAHILLCSPEEIDEAWGRSVDINKLRDNSLLMSDDLAGVIYRITYTGP